ncbi:PLP-dependent aminotransferase family protein [Gracilinema caldarium]|uniref:aminotransferase-like domain-containing protein n=1 Tax=Gracilinema caldarium TaxID=215591 RepID=UPI0026EC0B4C|nr:PLP-dependent aminotransferase family protein [Gracilinema caldarium]
MNYGALVFDANSETPLYLQLADRLRQAIHRGDVIDGERLPSIRRLSRALQVNPATAVAAYRILEQEGWVRSRPGSGVYAQRKRSPIEAEYTEPLFHAKEGPLIDLAAGTPSPDMFPVEQFKEIVLEVIERDAGWAFEYQNIAGWEPFRKTLSRYAAETLQIQADPSTIWVVSGAQQGIDLTAKALLHPGDRVIVEQPTYRGALGAFWSRAADTISLEIHEEGMDMEVLEQRLIHTRPRLLYIQSRFQTPTTYSWSAERLHRLLELADQYDFYILEDDLLSDLYFHQPPQPITLKSIDKNNRVLYVRGFSKVLFPGLRLGLLIIPPALQSLYEQAKRSSDIATDGFMQRTVDLYLQRNYHKSRMEELRVHFRDLHNIMYQAVQTHLEPLGCTAHFCDGGLHLWVRLPPEFKSTALYYKALEQGIRITSGEAFHDESHIRLSYVCIEPRSIDESIYRLSLIMKGIAGEK